MKDSQHWDYADVAWLKYIKESNERFSTSDNWLIISV